MNTTEYQIQNKTKREILSLTFEQIKGIYRKYAGYIYTYLYMCMCVRREKN